MGPRAEDFAYFAPGDILVLRGERIHVRTLVQDTVVKQFTKDGHFVFAGPNYDQGFPTFVVWIDGNYAGWRELESHKDEGGLSDPIWLGPDHLTLLGHDHRSHAYKVDVRIVAAESAAVPKRELLNLSGASYLIPTRINERSLKHAAKEGENIEASVTLTTQNDKPIAGVPLRAFVESWDSKEKVPLPDQVTTDSQGKATVTYAAPQLPEPKETGARKTPQILKVYFQFDGTAQYQGSEKALRFKVLQSNAP
jgi:hypothetical protein